VAQLRAVLDAMRRLHCATRTRLQNRSSARSGSRSIQRGA
jgi:hypothetical protein